MAKRILAKSGTRTQRATATIHSREPWRDSDSGRAGIGSTADTKDVIFDGVDAMTTLALSTAGDTTLALTSRHTRHTGLITIAAGGGAYTRNIIAPQSVTGIDGTTSCAAQAGDEIELRIEMAASTNPTVSIYHNSTGGSALTTIAGSAGAKNWIVKLRHNGTAWIFWDKHEVTT